MASRVLGSRGLRVEGLRGVSSIDTNDPVQGSPYMPIPEPRLSGFVPHPSPHWETHDVAEGPTKSEKNGML